MGGTKVIVFKSDDSMELRPYSNYETLQEAVGGLFQICGGVNLPDGNTATLFCNEEFLNINADEFKRVNVIASEINGRERIYGDAVLALDIVDDSVGFPEEMARKLMEYYQEEIKKLDPESFHKKYDNRKPEPKMEFYSFRSEEEFEKFLSREISEMEMD